MPVRTKSGGGPPEVPSRVSRVSAGCLERTGRVGSRGPPCGAGAAPAAPASTRPAAEVAAAAPSRRRRVNGIPSLLLVELDADRHALDAVEEVRPQPVHRPGELDAAQPRQELLEDDADLHARQVGTEAGVHAARPEGDLLVRRAADVEREGILEDR